MLYPNVRGKHKPEVLMNKTERKIFGSDREELTGEMT
jgi:hypothetical protein